MEGFALPYYYDDGAEFDPEQIPKPELCLKCCSNDIQDGDEEILCNLTRADQATGKDFRCYGFQPAV
jgi:hypothetical protein